MHELYIQTDNTILRYFPLENFIFCLNDSNPVNCLEIPPSQFFRCVGDLKELHPGNYSLKTALFISPYFTEIFVHLTPVILV